MLGGHHNHSQEQREETNGNKNQTSSYFDITETGKPPRPSSPVKICPLIEKMTVNSEVDFKLSEDDELDLVSLQRVSKPKSPKLDQKKNQDYDLVPDAA